MARPARNQIRRRLQQPPSHWTLLVLFLVALCLALVVEGYTTHEFGRSSTQPGGSGSEPAGLGDPGSVLDLSGPGVRAASPPPRVVALTFDDGPDPRWTPQILAVLRAHR